MADAASGPLIYLVAGEESGDRLGGELMQALKATRAGLRFAGVGGERMRGQGLTSLFDMADISVMGVSAVLARLPMLMNRISRTAADIVARKPDVVVLIDSPDFNMRVAKRVRAADPSIPIVKYVCPSVWAWRPGRAKSMRAHVDHVLALLPFEPSVLAELGGPPATYVGHPLAQRLAGLDLPDRRRPGKPATVLLLPGSRRGEIRLLLPDIAATVSALAARGGDFRYVLPAVPRLEAEIRAEVAKWPVEVEVVGGEEAKHHAFRDADVALAASGTVLLELALYKVPAISIYRLDRLMHLARFLIKGWAAALPNLIADSAFLPEKVGDMIRPGWLARAIEELAEPGPAREVLLDGYERMAQAMRGSGKPGASAAEAVLAVLDAGRGGDNASGQG
jgi:lipid-A-disaccharide synthase